MKEFDIQLALFQHFAPFTGRILIPNISMGYGEADFLSITKSGYVTEFEIKISRSDFAADKKKTIKHETYKKVFNNTPLICWYNGKEKTKKGVPNYFIYIVPDYFNIETLKVPEYAGLWVIDTERNNHYSCGFKCEKIPPRIHKDKFQLYWLNKIAKSYNAKYYYHYFKDMNGE